MASITSDEARKVIALMGGKSVFKQDISSPTALQDATRRGYPYGALEGLRVTLDISIGDFGNLLGVAERTLARRKKERVLSPIESDRVLRIALITSSAKAVFGTVERARSWLHRENASLGGRAPIAILDTEVGEHQVEEILTRINYGIFS